MLTFVLLRSSRDTLHLLRRPSQFTSQLHSQALNSAAEFQADFET